MVVQSPSYPHQKHGAISVLFTPKAGVNKHFLFNKAPRLFCTCGAHELAKLCAEHVEDANAASHQQDEVQDGWIAQQLVRRGH